MKIEKKNSSQTYFGFIKIGSEMSIYSYSQDKFQILSRLSCMKVILLDSKKMSREIIGTFYTILNTLKEEKYVEKGQFIS